MDGASRNAAAPNVRCSAPRMTAKAAGKSERYATSTAAANTASGVANPPNVVMVSTSQYSVPAK
jgi:hypothetical protein